MHCAYNQYDISYDTAGKYEVTLHSGSKKPHILLIMCQFVSSTNESDDDNDNEND